MVLGFPPRVVSGFALVVWWSGRDSLVLAALAVADGSCARGWPWNRRRKIAAHLGNDDWPLFSR